MDPRIISLSQFAREAIAKRDGASLQQSFSKILSIDPSNAEGNFLKGIYHAGASNRSVARLAFRASLDGDSERYDAGVELANLSMLDGENAEAKTLLVRFKGAMAGSPYYLNFAGEILTRMELHDLAGPCFDQANKLQSNVGPIEANLAASLAKRGKYDQAQKYYKKLLRKTSNHQRHHFELSRLKKATHDKHVREMAKILDHNAGPDSENIFLIFALAKELEDLGRWDEAFIYLQRGNTAAAQESARAGYQVHADIEALKAIETNFTNKWLAEKTMSPKLSATPIFIVGLPRTGTTLVERIIAQHSSVETAGESFFLDAAIQGVIPTSPEKRSAADNIQAGSEVNSTEVMQAYLDKVKYRLSGTSYFIEKLPLNFLNIGYILKAMPSAKIVILDRKPMDACFAMYKQPYFRFSYDLDWLAEYYIAFNSLRKHWEKVAGDNVISLNYEDLVFDTELQIRNLITALGLDFEDECLDFHRSSLASSTASFAQIRQKTHTDSVNKWLHWGNQLKGLKQSLDAASIDTSLYQPK